MEKKFIINRCCDCPFNVHGQENCIPIMESYLGYNFREYLGTSFGGPQLECRYDPDKDLRDNVRGRVWNKLNFIIWRASWYDDTNVMFDFDKHKEFKKQLDGFPKRCPLKEDL